MLTQIPLAMLVGVPLAIAVLVLAVLLLVPRPRVDRTPPPTGPRLPVGTPISLWDIGDRVARLEERALADIYLARLKDDTQALYEYGFSSCLSFYDKALERAGNSQGEQRIAAEFTFELRDRHLDTIRRSLGLAPC